MFRRILLAVLFAGLTTSSFAAAPPLFGGLFYKAPKSAFGAAVPRGEIASGHLKIEVDISTQSMVVNDDWHTVYTFDVSTGRPGHTTPTGKYRPIRMHEMWYSSKYENAPMPYAIFFHGGYAIHGTTDLKHLGQVASHGCVRLDPKNAKLLYELVKDVGMQNTEVVLLRS